MMASLVSCMRRAWGPARRMLVAVLVAVGAWCVCMWRSLIILPLDTRVGTIDVAIPKLRGTYFPEWLLQRRKRCESALITVVAHCYLAGVSTRRMDKLKAVTRNGSGADSWRYLLLLEVQRLNTCGGAD